MTIKTVAFFGWSGAQPEMRDFHSAKSLAKLVAESGRMVINGGGPGIMLAATLGAKEGNGKTTVVYYKPELATAFEGKSAVNYADNHFEEANYIKRTRKLLELGDAYVIFNGGSGTVSEFGMAWGLARLYFGHHKPLILYGSFWRHIMKSFKEHMHVREEEYEVFTIVDTMDEAMNAITDYETILTKNRRKHTHCAGPECHLLL
jgi:predicted Rossmann-fold nucleotide-binding protein